MKYKWPSYALVIITSPIILASCLCGILIVQPIMVGWEISFDLWRWLAKKEDKQ